MLTFQNKSKYFSLASIDINLFIKNLTELNVDTQTLMTISYSYFAQGYLEYSYD